MVHKQFHMVPRAFAERHLRPPRSRVFLVSSISSLLYFHHFRASSRQHLCLRTSTIGLYAFGIVIYARRRLRHPRFDKAEGAGNTVERGTKREEEREKELHNRNVAQKVELQFGRAQISRNDRQTPKATPRVCSSMPATARKCQGVGEALRKNFSPRTLRFSACRRTGESKAFYRHQRWSFMIIGVSPVLESPLFF